MSEAQKHVLIVDDDDLLRNSISGAIEAAGFKISVAKNGEEGLSAALSTHPDLILLDYQMPILDGLGMLQKLREDTWGQKVAVIVATNVYDINVINTVMQLGVSEYILKSSTSLEEIALLVKNHLSPGA